MLLRKRAWDIMRDDYTRIDAQTSLTDAIRLIREAVDRQSDNHVAVVEDGEGRFQGILTMWAVMKALQDCVFTDDAVTDLDHPDWDKVFGQATRSCSERGLGKLVRREVPVVRPNDPLVMVIETFLESRRGWAVVMEGDKVLGLILKSDVFKEMSRDVLGALNA